MRGDLNLRPVQWLRLWRANLTGGKPALQCRRARALQAPLCTVNCKRRDQFVRRCNAARARTLGSHGLWGQVFRYHMLLKDLTPRSPRTNLAQEVLHVQRNRLRQSELANLCIYFGPALTEYALATTEGMNPEPVKEPRHHDVLVVPEAETGSANKITFACEQVGLVWHVPLGGFRLRCLELNSACVHLAQEVPSKPFHSGSKELRALDADRYQRPRAGTGHIWEIDQVVALHGVDSRRARPFGRVAPISRLAATD